MENVVLVIHLILALCLVGVVLLQRSEGGGLGMGSGGGGGGVMTGRQAATALAKLTWVFAVLFFGTSIALTVIAARNSTGGSVMDQLGASAPTASAPASKTPEPGKTTAPATTAPATKPAAPASKIPAAKDLLPPSTNDAPTAPPRAGN